MLWTRRNWLWAGVAGISAGRFPGTSYAAESTSVEPLKITDLRVTPIALPDPPILAASGCHGPYFLRNIVELVVDGGLVGIGETTGGARTTDALEQARRLVVGQDVFAYRRFARQLDYSAYAGIELACLVVCGKATCRRLCELLG